MPPPLRIPFSRPACAAPGDSVGKGLAALARAGSEHHFTPGSAGLREVRRSWEKV